MTGPIVLAVESSGAASAVAVLDGERVLSERDFPRGQGGRGSGSPAAAAEAALAEAGASSGDVKVVAVSVGPGSYTGLRIGISFAKTFAWAVGAEVVAVPSLLALAEEFCSHGGAAGILVPTADAFRGQIYARAFRPGGGPDGLEEISGDMVLDPGGLPARLAEIAGPGEAITVFGSGASKYEETLRAAFQTAGLEAALAPEPASASAAAAGRLGFKFFTAGKTVTAHDLVPVYLRKTKAEEDLEKREGTGG